MSTPRTAELNKDAFRIVKAVVKSRIETALNESHGKGFFGSPRMVGGKLNGVNQWWFIVGGEAPTNASKIGKQKSFKSRAVVEGVFEDVDRAYELIPRVHELLPIEHEKSVHSLYSNGGGCETVALEFYEINGRDGMYGLYHVLIPLNIVVDFTYFEPEAEPES